MMYGWRLIQLWNTWKIIEPMKKNDVASFFYYMWNCWCEEECMRAFSSSVCGWHHIWNKWCQYSNQNGHYGAVEEFFANLDDENQDLLVERATVVYNRRRKIV